MLNVKLYRIALGYTQQEMADYLNIARQTYAMKETGKSSFNDQEKQDLKKLFKRIDKNVTIDELFFS